MGNRVSFKKKKKDSKEEIMVNNNQNEEIEEIKRELKGLYNKNEFLEKTLEKQKKDIAENRKDMKNYYQKIVENYTEIFSNMVDLKVSIESLKDFQRDIGKDHNRQIALLNEVIDKYDNLKEDLEEHTSNFSLFGIKLN